MKISISLLLTTCWFLATNSLLIQAQNSITLISPPANVTINEQVSVTVDYNNTELVDVYVLVRFKSPAGDNLDQAFIQVPPGQGSETMQIQAPSTVGAGYSYQAQMLKLAPSWAGLAEDNINNVEVVGANGGVNSITLAGPPTTVTSNEIVDVTINYNNTESTDVYVLVRFKSPTGDNLDQAFVQVPPGQGSETLQIQAPSTSGSGYSYQAQMLELAPSWAGLAEDNVYNVEVVGAGGGGANSITLINPPTSVLTHEIVDVTVDYNNAESTNGYVLVRFKSPTGEDLNNEFVEVPPGQGNQTFQLQAPATVGTGYRYQAQLLELAPSWAGLAGDAVDNVTVSQNTATESLSLVSWPDTIEIGGNYSISVSYVVTQNSIVYAQIFDREFSNGGGNWNKIGEGWVNVNAGSSTININDILIDLPASSSNRLELLLFHPSNGSWGDAVSIADASVNIPGRSGLLFGEESPSDPDEYMRYYERGILECNGGTYNGQFVSSGSGVDHTLAPTNKVYRSNWWVNHNWTGPIKSYYGEDEENGKNFWVEWQNLGTCGGGHAEFDIRVEKSNVSDFAAEAGFGARLGDITDPLECTFTGRWTPGSRGRAHINMTTWVYNTTDLIPNYSEDTRCDIIIHAFDNSGDFRHKYDTNLRWHASGNTIFYFDNIGTATSSGITYEVLRTMPGGFGEGASYNLIPTGWPREFVDEMPTNTINSTIDVNSILKDIIVLEADNGVDTVFRQDGSFYIADLVTEDWGLHVMEWTITGQSGTMEHDPAFPNGNQQVFIPNSMGRFTFEDYFIPNPCCSNPNVACGAPVDCDVPVNECQEYVTTSSNLVENEAVSIGIMTDGIVRAGSGITYTAGSYVLLQENFEVERNALFHAYITGCN